MSPRGGGDEPRIGVYVCHCGGNISDVVNCARVIEAVKDLPHVVLAREHSFMCSDPAQSVIIQDIQAQGLTRLVIASCSPSLHETTFRATATRAGLNPFLYEHVNIREQVSWVHAARPEEATAKAIRLIHAAVRKVALLEAQARIQIAVHRRALVLGGGVAGISAALSLARIGVPVALVERQQALGGHARSLGRTFPHDRPGRELVSALEREVASTPGLEVLTNAELVRTEGYLGNFKATIRVPADGSAAAAREIELPVGSIVVATGYQDYIPGEGELGFGVLPQVITLPRLLQLLEEARDGELSYEGAAIRRLAIIHCVGSRQIEGVHTPAPGRELNRHCSRVCCTASVRAAAEVRERFPETRVFVIFRDMRTYGRHHEACYERAARDRVVFIRHSDYELPEVGAADPGGEGPVRVQVADELSRGQRVSVDVDLVVLATGVLPGAPGAILGDLKLPVGTDGFLLEVHPKLRPVELAVQGVTVAGSAQAPMDLEESSAAAAAAAAKAARILTSKSVSLDPRVARVEPDLCDGCEACLSQCAYEGALRMEVFVRDGREVRRAVVNEALCKGCGACVAVCTPRAIDVVGFRLDQLEAYVDGLVAEME